MYFFDNFDPVNCPVKECHVFQPGCRQLDGNQKVTAVGIPKTDFYMVTSVISGYIEQVCIKCTNADGYSAQIDNWILTQSRKQVQPDPVEIVKTVYIEPKLAVWISAPLLLVLNLIMIQFY